MIRSQLIPLALLAFLSAGPATAQYSPDREVELCRQSYELGKFSEALQRAKNAMGVSNFTAEQRLTLHQIAGLAAFNLGDPAAAKEHFFQLLQLDPDYQLDPFAVAPVAIKLFEQVKKENAGALNVVRQQLALRLEQKHREQEEQERLKREDDERRRRLEDMTRSVTIRTVEHRSWLISLIPFGAGQFQQGRVEWGVVLAVSEVLLAVTSIISYFAINALFVTETITLPERTADQTQYSTTTTYLPDEPKRRAQYNVWTAMKFSTGGAFYAVWIAGVIDALVHHQAEVVTETKQPVAPAPHSHLELYLVPGGAGAGLTFAF